MRTNKPRYGRLAGIGTLLSLAACYGTLALVSILGTLGFAIVIDTTIWAGAIVAFAILAVIGLALGFSRHRKPLPILIGILGAGLIGYTMLADYSRIIELLGFALLSMAAFLEWRIKAAGHAK